MALAAPAFRLVRRGPPDGHQGWLHHLQEARRLVMTATLPLLPAGIYRHWKGHLYQVLGYASDSNDEGRIVVVYVGLELDGAPPGPRMHVRTASDFHGSVEVNGALVPRFEFAGPVW
jgi:hypothetical protein